MASAAPTTAWSPPAPRGTTTWRTVWRRSGAAARTYLQGGPRKLSPFFVPMMIPDIAAGVISIRHGFRGPNHCVVSACATGNHNPADGMEAIRRGGADVVVCGGSEAAVCELGLGGFAAMRAMSTRNDSPE